MPSPKKPARTSEELPQPNPKSGVTSTNAAALTATSTLAKRLVIRPGNTVLLLRAPEGIEALLEPLPEKAQIRRQARGTFDVVIAFLANQAELDAHAVKALSMVKPGGVAWLVYPKKTGAIKTDVTRDKGWDGVYAAGWRPVAQVAVNETWSATRWRPADQVGT